MRSTDHRGDSRSDDWHKRTNIGEARKIYGSELAAGHQPVCTPRFLRRRTCLLRQRKCYLFVTPSTTVKPMVIPAGGEVGRGPLLKAAPTPRARQSRARRDAYGLRPSREGVARHRVLVPIQPEPRPARGDHAVNRQQPFSQNGARNVQIFKPGSRRRDGHDMRARLDKGVV
jgi:hypothetical protein